MLKFIDARGRDSSWLTDELSWRRRSFPQDKRDLVLDIIENVKKCGDSALLKYNEQYDGIKLSKASDMLVNREDILNAYEMTDKRFVESIRKMKERICGFHKSQMQTSWMIYEDHGSILGQKVEPIENVGIYVPGGRASYPSSVLMNAMPAKLAGVKKVVMVSPPAQDGKLSPYTLVAANEAGCDVIFKAGGAHAIAALAYGTETIPKVDKIVGPGNIYVTLAKKEVYGLVDIDMIAGPSEVLVIADNSANPIFIAADLLAQAEHDPMASSILLTDSHEIAQSVLEQIEAQKKVMDRISIIDKSLSDYGAIVVLDSIKQAIDTANMIAPEHLELCVREPFESLNFIKNAGAIFLGSNTPEAIGDYMAGPNHVLPTNGTARFFSPLSVEHFVKKSSVIYFTDKALESIAKDAIELALAEGLSAHANSIEVRLKPYDSFSSSRSQQS
jgi:histidinol dehydrogenase